MTYKRVGKINGKPSQTDLFCAYENGQPAYFIQGWQLLSNLPEKDYFVHEDGILEAENNGMVE